MKRSIQAAALLASAASFAAPAAQAFSCMPSTGPGLITECNARSTNEKYKLELDPSTGCAKEQTVKLGDASWGHVHVQVRGARSDLRVCEESETMSVSVEL